MPRQFPRRLAILFLAAIAGTFSVHAEAEPGPAPVQVAAELRGCWQNLEHPEVFMWLTERRCIQSDGGWHSGDPAEMRDGKLVLGDINQRVIDYKIADGVLDLSGPKGKLRLKKLERVPEVLENLFKPMTLGDTTVKLSDERIEAICKDIEARHTTDQAVRGGKKDYDAMHKVDVENEAAMIKLLQEVGWIDVDRFGYEASYQSWLMMMHYVHNWPLMAAVLPEIKKDTVAKKFDGNLFAGLFDRVRGVMGEPYRYGQVVTVINTPIMGPFENFEKADEYRKEIGLPTVEEERKKFSHEHNNVEVKIIKK